MYDAGLVWFRRDLRDEDHAALGEAIAQCRRVWCVFVFDVTILEPLRQLKRATQRDGEPSDRRVDFIRASVIELDAALRERGGGLITLHGNPCEVVPALAEQLEVDAVFANRDYEPVAIERDETVAARLHEAGRELLTFKDQVIFERDDILTAEGKPYSVFTPYKNAWLKRLAPSDIRPHSADCREQRLCTPPAGMNNGVPSLAALGFAPSNLDTLALPAGMRGALQLLDDFMTRIDSYAEQRNFPAVKGPSYLSVHLRFGTVSIRSLVRMAHTLSLERDGQGAATWLSELVWREFFFTVLAHHPRVASGASFKPEFDALRWERGAQADAAFEAWRDARTGFPLVDAAMRQLTLTGYMHNRLRMVTASFLVKDLGIDWRLGERHFAELLNDFDFANNNGGWQWAASTGCDAQPWFRIFNPVTQSQQFDPEGRFIKRYVPELAALPVKWIHAPWLAGPDRLAEAGIVLGRDYPHPIVDHAEARQRTLGRFGAIGK